MKEGGGGGGGEGRKVSLPFFPTHSPLFYSRHFSRGVCSLLRKRAETLLRRLIGHRLDSY